MTTILLIATGIIGFGIFYKSIDFFETVFENNKKEGSPKIGLNIFMTEQSSFKLSNLLNNLSENKLKVQSGIYQKT